MMARPSRTPPPRACCLLKDCCLLHAVAWHWRGQLSNPRLPPGSGFRCKHSCPQGDRLGPAGAGVWGEGLGAGSLLWRRQGRPAALSPDLLPGPSLLALPRPGRPQNCTSSGVEPVWVFPPMRFCREGASANLSAFFNCGLLPLPLPPSSHDPLPLGLPQKVPWNSMSH